MISAGGMKSPWSGGDEDAGQQQVLALGQIMERSTSAPPVSTERHRFSLQNGQRDPDSSGDFLFDNARNMANADTLLFAPGGRESAPLETDASNSLFLQSDYDKTSSRQIAPSIYTGTSTSLSDALLSSGLSDRPANSWGLMERSRSAAPQINPPPGMENHRSIYDQNDRVVLGERRSASTGVLGGENETPSSVFASLGLEPEASHLSRTGGAVRPAPKTLMDLIQEDSPNDNQTSPAYRQDGLIRPSTAAPYLERRDVGGYFERSKTASPTFPFNEAYDSHRARPNVLRPDIPAPLVRPTVDSVYSHRQEQEQTSQPVKAHFQREKIRQIDGRYQQESVAGITQRMERVQIGRGGPHYEVAQPKVAGSVAGSGTQYITVPVSHLQRGSAAAMGNPRVRQEHVQIQQPHSVYAPISQPHVISQSGQFETQQLFYANGQPGHQVDPQQMHILPTGQTVYVNTPPYGYATVQYHTGAPPSQGQMVTSHHPHPEFVSVLPVQPGGQVAYWQHPEMQGVAQTVIMNSHGAPAVTMPRGGTHAMEPRLSSKPRGGDSSTRSPKGSRGSGKRSGGSSSNRRDDSRSKTVSAVSSPLLEEFRATKNRDWTVDDISGHVVEFCQDQNGSRFIQQRLEMGVANEQQVVMNEVLPAVRQLRNDVFGNYVVQKLLEFGTLQMKNELRDTLEGEMLPLSLQMYGCRVVQKALEMLDEDDLPRLLVEFHQNVLSCIHDQNGNHVIQKCIEVMSAKSKRAAAANDPERATFFSEQIDFIINDVLQNAATLSCHPYGCRVLQRILEHCVEPEKTRALDEISKCHKVLLDDQYGNYVIQHVLQYGRNSDRASICQIVVDNGLLSLSKQKFASNVVEKLLKYGTPSQRNILVREMLKVVVDPTAGASGSSSVVLLMVRDAYANYVVQTALDVVPEGQEKIHLLEELDAHSTQLRNYTFAKHIVTKLNSFSTSSKD